MKSEQDLKTYICDKFIEHLGLTKAEVLDADITLAEIIEKSPHMTNSVDLMEAFAKTANCLRKEHGLRVRLPALALDTRISRVLDAYLAEVTRQQKEHAA